MEKYNWNAEFDVVVVGSGASGLMGALVARHHGLSVLIVEKTSHWGGSTALSGGGIWAPNNRFMKQAGALDSAEEALTYLEAVVGNAGPGTTTTRKQAYVKYVSEMIDFLSSLGFRWVHDYLYPDYYPNVKGAKTGRTLEGDVFNGKKLGKLRHTLRKAPGMPDMALTIRDFYLLPVAFRRMKGFFMLMKAIAKTAMWKLSGRQPLTLGRSLVGQLMYLIQRAGQTPIWLNTAFKEVLLEGNRAVGILAEQDGKSIYIKARQAVLLGTGGFPHNTAMRRQYQHIDQHWSSAAPGNTGDAIRAAEQVGAALAQMDAAWWGASYVLNGKISFSLAERSMPGCILVDQEGKRYANESTSYMDLGQVILDRHRRQGNAIPSWLIMDHTNRSRYFFGMMLPGMTPRQYIRKGDIIKANSIDELAEKCQIPADILKESIRRFNSFALHGKDEDFGRGQDIYDRYYSDDLVRPNSNLAPIQKPPFYAIKIYPGDIGTNGGLLTDEHGRVLQTSGEAFENLYAAGDDTASVMGYKYPGAGSAIGAACVFAYAAMQHLLQQQEKQVYENQQ